MESTEFWILLQVVYLSFKLLNKLINEFIELLADK